MSSYTRGKTPGKVQYQVTKKEQMVDQNYANNTLFMTLSDIEAIEQKYLYPKPQPKQFGMYDPVDYSHREIQVLKEQLRLKLILVKSSLLCWNQDYGNGSYKLPRDFNQERVIQRLSQFQRTFDKYDKDCSRMCQDLKNMLNGKNANYSFENTRFKNAPNVSHEENVRGLVNASSKIREEKKQFEKNYDQKMEAEDIRFKSNQSYKSPNEQRSNIKTITYSNGDTYEGEVFNSYAHGEGILYTHQGKLKGKFWNGEMDGQYIFTDKRTDKIQTRIYKKGELKKIYYS